MRIWPKTQFLVGRTVEYASVCTCDRPTDELGDKVDKACDEVEPSKKVVPKKGVSRTPCRTTRRKRRVSYTLSYDQSKWRMPSLVVKEIAKQKSHHDILRMSGNVVQ